MQKVQLAAAKTQFLEKVEESFAEALRKILELASDTEPGQPVDEGALNAVAAEVNPHDFAITIESLLDSAIAEHSESYEPYDAHFSVVGRLDKYTLKDDFVLSIEVKDTTPNNALLHQMKQDGWVHIEAAQGALFTEGEDSKADEEPEDNQPELPGTEETEQSEAA